MLPSRNQLHRLYPATVPRGSLPYLFVSPCGQFRYGLHDDDDRFDRHDEEAIGRDAPGIGHDGVAVAVYDRDGFQGRCAGITGSDKSAIVASFLFHGHSGKAGEHLRGVADGARPVARLYVPSSVPSELKYRIAGPLCWLQVDPGSLYRLSEFEHHAVSQGGRAPDAVLVAAPECKALRVELRGNIGRGIQKRWLIYADARLACGQRLWASPPRQPIGVLRPIQDEGPQLRRPFGHGGQPGDARTPFLDIRPCGELRAPTQR